MSSPVGEFRNPFEEFIVLTDSPLTSPSFESRSRYVSMEHTASPSPTGGKARDKKRVGFTGDNTPNATPSASLTPGGSGSTTPAEQHAGETMAGPSDSGHRSHLPSLSPDDAEQIKQVFAARIAKKPRPAIRNLHAAHQSSTVDSEDDSDGLDNQKAYRRLKAREALQRGKDLEQENVRTWSEPVSPASSEQDIPLESWPTRSVRDKNSNTPTDINPDGSAAAVYPDSAAARHSFSASAQGPSDRSPDTPEVADESYFRRRMSSGIRSGAATPIGRQNYIEDYTPAPERYRGSLLGALMELREWMSHGERRPQHTTHERHIPPQIGSTPFSLYTRTSKGDLLATSPAPSPSLGPTPISSGTSTPRGWRHSWQLSSRQHSSSSLSQLVESSGALGSPAAASFSEEVSRRLRKHKDEQKRPSLGERVRSSGAVESVGRQFAKLRKKEEYRIKRHISEVTQRQNYILKLCKSLMTFGAPTHRLEDYLSMSARVLEIDAQFLYLPSAMIVSFQDPTTHTTDVKLVKAPTALHLGKMRDVHEIYKEVVHDHISAHEGLVRLHEVSSRPLRLPRWALIPFYGLASLSVGPFAFGAQWTDLGPCFLLGCLVGFLQLCVAPMDRLYSDVFEIVASILTSCIARFVGSIGAGSIFCFSAQAQSSLALILPGYMVLMASLELQSRNMVAGSVRMVHAIIYSLALGYGITIGTALCGVIYPGATSTMVCDKPISSDLNLIFVAIFTGCLMVINRATWKQAPVMLIISLLGYLVNYYSAKWLHPSAQVANTLGALAIGSLANLYSRCGPMVENKTLDLWDRYLRTAWLRVRDTYLPRRDAESPSVLENGECKEKSEEEVPRKERKGRSLAAAVMLPAILVQVPSGISVGGSLLSGLEAANMLTSGSGSNTTQSATESMMNSSINSTAFTVGFSVIQVAIGLTTGLFLSAIVWYPRGKARSGFFSF